MLHFLLVSSTIPLLHHNGIHNSLKPFRSDFKDRRSRVMNLNRKSVITKASNHDFGTPEFSDEFSKNLEEENKLFKNKPSFDPRLYYINHVMPDPDSPDNLEAKEGRLSDRRRLIRAWNRDAATQPLTVEENPVDLVHNTNPVQLSKLLKRENHTEYHIGYWTEKKKKVIVKSNTDSVGEGYMEHELTILNKFKGRSFKHIQLPIATYITNTENDQHIYHFLYNTCLVVTELKGNIKAISLVAYGLAYSLHEMSNKKLAHMNINLDNVLVCNGVVKLANLEYAQDSKIASNHLLKYSDAHFIAPEAATMYLPPLMDLYAAGQVLHYLLTGEYGTATTDQEWHKIQEGFDFVQNLPADERESDAAKEFYLYHLSRSLMHVNPMKRPSIKDVLLHPAMPVH